MGHTWFKQKANYIHLSKERRLMEGTAIIGLDERKTKCVLMFHDINNWKKEKKSMHERQKKSVWRQNRKVGQIEQKKM